VKFSADSNHKHRPIVCKSAVTAVTPVQIFQLVSDLYVLASIDFLVPSGLIYFALEMLAALTFF
jgi:hypothetical protein